MIAVRDIENVLKAARVGNPSDLEGITAYLMSDASAYHTGDLIVIDGGLSVGL